MKNTCKIFYLSAVIAVSTLPTFARGDFWMHAEGPFGGLIQALAVDSTGTVLAGTLNAGVFRSTDHGQTWAPASAGLGALSVSALAVYRDGKWLAGVSGGAQLYRSSNQGTSWTAANTGLGLTTVDALVCAGTSTFACGYYGVHTSTDGGTSWTNISNALSTLRVRDVAVESTGGLFAGTSRGIFYSTDGGTTWEQRNSGLAADTSVLNIALAPGGEALLSTSRNQGVYRSTDHGLSWTKKSTGIPNGYAAGLMSTSDGNAFVSIQHADLYRSTDLGDSWSPVSGLLEKDVRGMSPSGSGDLYAGEFGAGVSRSTDAGLTWVQGIQGMSASHVSALAHNTSGLLVAATSGAGMHRSTDDGHTWSQAITGLANIDVRSTAISVSGIVYAGTFGNSVFRSDNEGITWIPKTTGMGTNEAYAILTMGADSVLAGCRNNGIFLSTNRGENWAPSDSGIPGGVTIYCFALIGESKIAAGTSSPGIYISTDRGVHWQQSDSGLTTKDVRSIVASSPNKLFAGTSGGGIFRSTDGGTSWHPANIGYESDGNAIVVGPNGYLFAGGNNSVYVSTDNGDAWTQMTAGMGYPRVYSLDISPNGTLIAGTYGNGVYYSAIAVEVREHVSDRLPSAPYLGQNFPNPFNPTSAINYQLPGASDVRLVIYDLLGREVEVLVNERKAPGSYEVKFDAVGLASGIYLYRLTAGSFVHTRKMILVK